MQRVIFLVTSLNGMHKPNFTKQLLQALQQGQRVVILAALIDFEATWTVRAFLNRLAQTEPQVKQIELLTLADLFKDESGLTLTSDERNMPDLVAFDERLFVDGQEQVKRYLNVGHLVAERRQLDDETPMVLRQYQTDQLVQIDTYDLSGRVVGIEKIVDEVAQTSYVLNQKGEAVLRFVRHERPIEKVYNLSATSAMLATQFAEAKQAAAMMNMSKRERDRAAAEVADQTSIIKTTETYYGVLAYSNYQRFGQVYAFYESLLSRLMTSTTRLYVDLADNAALAPQMPDQLIFNY
ncbi:hypothetical protein NE303_02300 [Levilactobacillus brevis]|uniref:hypothetical protein n=1 Tax=Levilactobacillus brevis TaxID=1580 RepID=UPI000E091EC4|nr:hypothetical protein [Levilactobacillus brevis]MBT9677381.1 hypothetical protein [Levilactobacillus brevis]MCM6799693.1 hypothetical protein [Levilactobacillus brevis]MCM6801608.1 hypothetical protein [Levilactobacillus brevis]MCM6804897.1 hypothetical protein [Levilactobacillus brevis]MCM6807735.1 hypothetical protein [Levilactobacillus brevis]